MFTELSSNVAISTCKVLAGFVVKLVTPIKATADKASVESVTLNKGDVITLIQHRPYININKKITNMPAFEHYEVVLDINFIKINEGILFSERV